MPKPAALRELRQEIEEFNAEYAHVLDEGDLEDWIDFFAEDAVYRITGRENADAGLPIGLMYCDGRGMFVEYEKYREYEHPREGLDFRNYFFVHRDSETARRIAGVAGKPLETAALSV